MSNANQPAAEGQISKKDPVIPAHHQSAQMYFCPQTEELIFLADSEAGPFEQHWRDMLTRMDDYHQANGEYSTALEYYAQAYTKGDQPATEVDKRLMAVSAAEEALQKKRDKLLEKIDKFAMDDMSYKDVVELLPIGDTRARNKSGSLKVKGATGRRYVYVKKKVFDDALEKKKLHPVALNGKKKGQSKSKPGNQPGKAKQQDLPKGGEESIYVTNSAGKSRIDKDKLAKQLKKLDVKAIKLELGDAAKWFGFEKQLEWLEMDASLFEWADTWNASPNIDVSAGAQFFRYAHNVGASLEYDPAKGQFAIKGEAKGSLTAAAGFSTFAIYAPDRLGWSLAYQSKGQALDMGMLRLCLEGQVSGFIGASAQLEGQLQVVRQGETQQIAGQPGGRLPRFAERQLKSKKPFHQKMDEKDEGVQLSVEVFVGAKAEAALKGSMQWMKPTLPPENEAKRHGLVQGVLKDGKNSGEFVDFCTIGYSIAGLYGVGGGFTFHCTFIKGKFCFHFAASLCWGPGAKGGLIAEVGLANIVEFGAWLIYQLYRLDYSFLDIVEEDAFKAYSQYCLLRLQKAADEVYTEFGREGLDVRRVGEYFNNFIDSLEDKLKASKQRNELAKDVISRRLELLRYTPEAKGILLYLLTRHGVWDHLDNKNRGSGWVPDIYQDRKDAVICVLRSIQTRSEWNKTLCRMTRDGSSLAEGGNEAAIVARQRQHLVDFLQEGFNRDADLYKAERVLAVIYDRIKLEVSWGYALDMNDTSYYQLNQGPNPHYPRRCTFGPCAPEESQIV